MGLLKGAHPARRIVAVVCILGAVAAALLLGTARGRQGLLDAVARAVQSPGFRLELRDLELGGTCTLGRLAISDAAGTWLLAEDVSVRPVVKDLLQGMISLDHLGVGNFVLERLPSSGESTGGAPTLPRLRIRSVDAPRIRLGAGVIGREALLRLTGAVSLAGAESRATLEAARLDRTGDRLDLNAVFRPKDGTLRLVLDLQEAPEGLLHAALGVNGTEGISIQARGDGPVSAWPLAFSARVSDAADLSANATLAMVRSPEFSVRAALTPGPGWTALTALPPDAIRMRAEGLWDSPVLRVRKLELDSPAAAVSADLEWDSGAGTLRATTRAEGRNLSPFLPPALIAGHTSARADIGLDGRGLRTVADISLRDWTVSGRTVPSADVNATLVLPPAMDVWNVNATVHAATPFLPEGLRSWAAAAALESDGDGVRLNRLDLTGASVRVEAAGDLDASLALNLRTRVFPSPDISPSADLESTLTGRIDTEMPSLSGVLDLNATNISGLPARLTDLLGADLRLRSDFVLTADRLLIREAEATGRTKARLGGEFIFEPQRFKADVRGTLPLVRLGGLVLPPGTGFNGDVSGTPASFETDLSVTCKPFKVRNIDIRDLSLRARAGDLPGQLSGILDAEALLNGEQAELELGAAWRNGQVSVTDGILRLPDTEIAVQGDIDPSAPVLTGTVRAQSTDLRSLGNILGTKLGGRLSLEATLEKSTGGQGVRIDADGTGLDLAGASVAQATARGNLIFPEVMEKSELDLKLSSVRLGDISQDSIAARLRGSDAGLAMDATLKDSGTDLDLRLQGRLSPDLGQLLVSDVHGTLLALPLRMQSPLDLRLGSTDTGWAETVLTLGSARLSSRGEVTPERIDITAAISNLDPSQLRSRYPSLPAALVNAEATVRGTPTEPDARLTVRAGNISFASTDLANLPAMEASADCRLRHDAIEARANLAAGSDVRLEVDFTAPALATLRSLELPPDARLAGAIRGRTRLSLLPHVLRLDDQTLEGDCDIDYRIDGTWREPTLAGRAAVRDARYENFRSGTVIAGIQAEARADGSKIVAEASGTDGQEGMTWAQALVNLSNWSYSVDARMDGFRLLRTDLVRSLVEGTAHLQGAPGKPMSLQGSLTMDPTDVRIPSGLSGEAPHIEVREINTGEHDASTLERKARFPLHLDLNVNAPARLAVRGRGLDSEWSGKIHVGGTQIKPVISGEAHLLRGKLDFLDRTFELTRGTLAFNGETPPNPFLDIIGEIRVLDTLIQVNLAGPARSPRLTLSSTPSLPQDELLSMILFGRSMREISPLQAVRLAQAAAEMTGIGAGPGFLQSLKSNLGLRELDVSRDDDNNTAVGVGGYIGGKYYFRTRSSVSGQDKTKVEVQLTPDISVETEVGTDSRQGGGINWKHDY